MQIAAPFAAPPAPAAPAAAEPRPAAGRGQAARSWSAWLLPSFADLLFVVCLLAALRSGAAMLSADGDPARHLTVGEHILATGTIPRVDLFSYTMAGRPFVPYEWLAEVASAAAYRLAGLGGTVLLHAAVIAATFAVLFAHLRRRGHGPLLAFGVALVAAMTSGVHWSARPHLFTFLGTAVFAAVLDGWHTGRLSSRWLWALPAGMALWANAHGGFLVGLVLLGAYVGADAWRWLAAEPAAAAAAGRRLRALLPVTLATVAATALNPAGPALLAHVTGYFGKPLLVNNTSEYLSPDFHQTNVRLFLALLLGAVAGCAWLRRPTVEQGLLLIGFTFFSLYAQRNIPLFAILVAPLLAAQLAALPGAVPWGRRPGRVVARVHAWLARREQLYGRMDARSRGHLWPALVAAGLLWVAAGQWQTGQAPLGARFDPAKQPVAAVAYLQSHPPAGNGYNEMGWGGSLLHELWPAQRVFIDGQTDFYGEPLFRDYLTVEQVGAGWQGVLDRYDVRWVLYETDSPLVRALAAAPGWQVTYQDPIATVLSRTY